MARRKNAQGEPKVVAVLGVTPKWAEGLTHRERRFVEHYLVDLNATRAAHRIGKENQHDGKQYANNESACVAGMQFLAKPEVAKAIEIALKEVGVTRVWIIDRLAKLASSDLSQFVRKVDGHVKVFDTADVDSYQHSNMAELSETITEFGTAVHVKVHDPKPALFKLAKLLGMEKDSLEISGPDGGAIQVESPKARVVGRLEELKKRLAATNTTPEVPKDGA